MLKQLKIKKYYIDYFFPRRCDHLNIKKRLYKQKNSSYETLTIRLFSSLYYFECFHFVVLFKKISKLKTIRIFFFLRDKLIYYKLLTTKFYFLFKFNFCFFSYTFSFFFAFFFDWRLHFRKCLTFVWDLKIVDVQKRFFKIIDNFWTSIKFNQWKKFDFIQISKTFLKFNLLKKNKKFEWFIRLKYRSHIKF